MFNSNVPENFTGYDSFGTKYRNGKITNTFNGERDFQIYDNAELQAAEQRLRLNAEGRADVTLEGFDISTCRFWANKKTEWLVSNVFAKNQPIVFGAPSKSCKTTMLMDLAIALATGGNWLDYYHVPKRLRTLLITGETGMAPFASRMKRALDAKGLSFQRLKNYLRVETEQFPKIAKDWHLQQLAKTIEKYQIEVVIIDPLYRALGGLDLANVSEVGEAIIRLNQYCRPATLIMAHHTTKSAAREKDMNRMPSLEDLTGAGLAESVGSWWLIKRPTA